MFCVHRHCAPEFVRCASELLPPMETESGVPLEACRLADTLDEIIITIGSQIEDILEHLPDERKAASLALNPISFYASMLGIKYNYILLLYDGCKLVYEKSIYIYYHINNKVLYTIQTRRCKFLWIE